jgi:hypothetical protein
MSVRNLNGSRAPTPPVATDRRETESGRVRNEPNRRRYPRIPAPIQCRSAGVDFFAPHLEPIDVSLGGLRIHSNDEYRVGAILPLDVIFARIAPVTFTTEIMWIEALRAGSQGRFDVGLAFVDLHQCALKLLLSILASKKELVGSALPRAQKTPMSLDRAFEGSLGEPASEVRRVAPESATVRTGRSSQPMLLRTPIVIMKDAELRSTPLDGRSGFLVSLIDGVTSVESLIDLSGMPAEQMLAVLEDLRRHRIVDL